LELYEFDPITVASSGAFRYGILTYSGCHAYLFKACPIVVEELTIKAGVIVDAVGTPEVTMIRDD
jgi:hypothetical protein